jgi:hypothetical protein
MTEEEAKAVSNQEVGAPDAPKEGEANQQAQTEPAVGSKEYNFRRLEQEKRDLEKRLREQEQFIKETVSALKPKESLPQEEVLPQLAADDIPEWKHVQAYTNRMVAKTVSEIIEKKEREKLPLLTRQRYTDFDEIVTEDRVKKLEQEDPSLAQAFSMSANPFAATYSYFKTMYGAKKLTPEALEEVEKLKENATKPNSINAIGRQGALKNANAFAKKPREQLYKEMMQAAARAS